MKVQVTQEDIDKGAIKSCNGCPIARAITRITTHCWRVRVTSCAAVLEHKYSGFSKAYNLPELAIRFIRDFDSGIKVAPISIELKENV